jgi:cell division septation protein DedD
MNDKGRKEGASVRIVGREFIIVIVVVFSSLSFTLGFFVGKNNAEKKTEYVVQTAPKPADGEPLQNAISAQLQPSKPEGRTANGEAPLQDRKAAQQTVTSPPETRTGGDKAGPEHREAESNLPKEVQKKEAGESAETNNKSNAKPVGGEIMYTVQLEALKNAAEAHRLKTKYAKKGYKIYITVSRNKHKEKIFKVRAGEFKEKKDAEILALRLKKNEGLAAFVTVRND